MAVDLSGPLSGRRQTWAEIDLDALAANLRILRDRVGAGRRVMAMVKADAYGHGAEAVSLRLEAEKIDLLGVAIPEEGHALRSAGVKSPIVVLGAADPSQIQALADDGMTPTAYSLSFLEAILSEGARRGAPLSFHLKVDTGMGRLGVLPEHLGGALSRITAARGSVVLEGLLTHLSCSEDPGDPHTAIQLERFSAVVREVRAAGFAPRYIHAANSGGLLGGAASWFDTVRPGLALYGLHPSAASAATRLRPVLAFKSRLVLVKRVRTGSWLGYGHAFSATRDCIIGTIAAGYADGLPRMVSGSGRALVRGRRASYAGRVSMDMAMIDLTDVPAAAEGDEVVLIGSQEDEAIETDEFAAWSGTSSYEALCRIGARVPRLHLSSGASPK